MHALMVGTSAGVAAHVGETAQGGPPENAGDAHTTGNHAPVVSAPGNRTIPIRTPFTLRGAGSDRDGDSLTYLWEQNDIGGAGGTALVDNTKKNGPLFRVFGRYAQVSSEDAALSPAPGENLATGRASRTFPNMEQVLAGNTNAKSGRCPKVPPPGDTYVPVARKAVACYSEFLPTKRYVGTAGTPGSRAAMHFRLTARDARPGGGGVGHDDVTLRIDHTAGPFLVTSFKRGGKVDGGTTRPITWQVNGTRKLAARVEIVLSTNNGKTWGKVLRATANDGRATVRFPAKKADQARIMIRAVDNYFFDLNDKPFRIR
jgi:hypothetical protein